MVRTRPLKPVSAEWFDAVVHASYPVSTRPSMTLGGAENTG
jgi:hypothetical protein